MSRQELFWKKNPVLDVRLMQLRVGGQLFQDTVLTTGSVYRGVVCRDHGNFQALFDSAGEVLLQFFIIRSHCELERGYLANTDYPEEISRCFRVISRPLVVFVASFVLFAVELCDLQHNWDEGEGFGGTCVIQCLH